MKKFIFLFALSLLACSSSEEPSVAPSEQRVFYDKLTNHGTDKNPVMYIDSDLFSGVAFELYPSGQMHREFTYEDGKEVRHTFYYENGQLSSIFNYTADGESNGLHQTWHENGQLEYQANFKNGQFYGLYQEWYENGQMSHEFTYKDGQFDGLGKTWDENGVELN